MRFGLYCAASVGVCGVMLAEALLVYPNLFSALVGLSDSVVKVCALINLACCLTVLWTKMVLYLFLGGARANEMQTVYNKGWMFLCNSIFYWSMRDLRAHITAYDLGVCMLSIFVLIALHWICNERVKVAFVEVEPVSYFNIARLGALCFILGGIDIALCHRAITDFLKGKYTLSLFSMFLLDLIEMSVIFVGHYVINLCEMIYLMRNEDEDEWDRKVLLHTLVNLTSCISGIIAHCIILYVFNVNTSDILTFCMRIVTLYQDGKEITRMMTSSSDFDNFSKPAEASDLERDNICVICRDEMTIEHQGHPKKAAKRLHCGHVMHAGCLKSWMARSDKCPTCRQSVYTAASAFGAVEQQPTTQLQDDSSNAAEVVQLHGNNAVPLAGEVAGPAQTDGQASREGVVPPVDEAGQGDANPLAPVEQDEDVSDLFMSGPAPEPTRTVPLTHGTEECARITSKPISFMVERETPFSGRIVAEGNVAQAYTFRENYLF